MKPFCALKFFKENKKKGLLTIIVLILSVCAVSIITVLINSIHETCDDTMLRPFMELSLVTKTTGQFYLDSSVADKLKSDSNIDRIISCDVDETSFYTTIGNTQIFGIFADKSDINFILNKEGDSVKQGRMPEDKTNEIAVHWRIMSNKKWKIGQIVGSDKDSNEGLSGSYKIVGVLDGPTVAMVGTQSYRDKQYIKNGLDITKTIAYAVIPKVSKLTAVNKTLEKISKNNAEIVDYTQIKKDLDKFLSSINSILIAIILIVTIILSISVGSLMYLIYLQRSDEFGILIAMGYRKNFIYHLIFKEVLSLDIISWVAGIIFSYLAVQLLNELVYVPQGNILNFLNLTVFEYSLAIPLMVAIFSALPILMKMRKQDPITIIERRD